MSDMEPTEGMPCDFTYKQTCGKTESPHFCEPRADYAEDIVGRLISPETGEPFVPLQWQLYDVILPLFGVVKWHTRRNKWLKRYREVWLTMPRKNGKTWLAAAITAVQMRMLPPNSQMLMGEQSVQDALSIVGAATQDFISSSPKWSDEIKWVVSKNTFVNEKTGTTCRIAPVAQPKNIRGGKYVWSCLDEIAFYNDPEMTLSVIKKSWGNLHEPVVVMMTTLPWDLMTWGRDHNRHMENVKLDPDREPDTLPVIYRLEDTEDWKSEDTWIRVSPSLREGMLDLDDFRLNAKKAETNFEARRAFLGEDLNAPVSSEDIYIEVDIWDQQPEGMEEITREEVWDTLASLKGEVFAGADFADVNDFCSFVLIAVVNEYLYVWHQSWVPRKIRAKLDNLLNGKVSRWIEQGHLREMPDELGPEFVAREIVEFAAGMPGLELISFDKHRAEEAKTIWDSYGIKHQECRQGRALTPAIQALKRHSLARRVVHAGDPVLRHGVQSATLEIVTNTDQWQLTKPDRVISARRIDPVIGLCNAVQGRMKNMEEIYKPRAVSDVIKTIDWI